VGHNSEPRRAVISTPNISFFDKNATPEAADRG
jgi:hypothetical protein